MTISKSLPRPADGRPGRTPYFSGLSTHTTGQEWLLWLPIHGLSSMRSRTGKIRSSGGPEPVWLVAMGFLLVIGFLAAPPSSAQAPGQTMGIGIRHAAPRSAAPPWRHPVDRRNRLPPGHPRRSRCYRGKDRRRAALHHESERAVRPGHIPPAADRQRLGSDAGPARCSRARMASATRFAAPGCGVERIHVRRAGCGARLDVLRHD